MAFTHLSLTSIVFWRLVFFLRFSTLSSETLATFFSFVFAFFQQTPRLQLLFIVNCFFIDITFLVTQRIQDGDELVTGPRDQVADGKSKIAKVYPIKTKSSGMVRQTASKRSTEGCTGESEEWCISTTPDVLVKNLVLEHDNSVQTPAVHDVTDEKSEPLNQIQSSKYRSQVARSLFHTVRTVHT